MSPVRTPWSAVRPRCYAGLRRCDRSTPLRSAEGLCDLPSRVSQKADDFRDKIGCHPVDDAANAYARDNLVEGAEDRHSYAIGSNLVLLAVRGEASLAHAGQLGLHDARLTNR